MSRGAQTVPEERALVPPTKAVLSKSSTLAPSLAAIPFYAAAEPLFDLTSRGAQQLLNRDEYVAAVLGGTR